MITHKEYMANISKLHPAYYLQFATEGTTRFVLERIGMDKLLNSTCPHLNDIVKHSGGDAGSWVWDFSPCNVTLMREVGAVSAGCLPSPSMCTCVGKAVAKELIREHHEKNS